MIAGERTMSQSGRLRGSMWSKGSSKMNVSPSKKSELKPDLFMSINAAKRPFGVSFLSPLAFPTLETHS